MTEKSQGNSTRDQFYSMFLDRSRELYSGEEQILDALPIVLDSVSSEGFRLALENLLGITKKHLEQIQQEFLQLSESPKGLFSEPVSSMLQECQYLKTKRLPNVVKEAALITSFQKILHYQIAGYGALKMFAKHLNLDKLYFDLTKVLKDKSTMDLHFTKVAEGDYFTKGINEAAAE